MREETKPMTQQYSHIDIQYQSLLNNIVENGVEKSDRTGAGTLSIFGHQIRHNMQDGFPLLTTKKMSWKNIVTELLWFLKGDTNIRYLLSNNCNIWNGDAYKHYFRYNQGIDMLTIDEFIHMIKTNDDFSNKWGDLGRIYGAQWRNWECYTWVESAMDGKIMFESNYIDQIQNLIEGLKTNPDSRRLMVSAWAVDELPDMVLPPCHYAFQVYTRELSIEERLRLASKTYRTFEPSDFVRVDHLEIDELYPVPKRAISLMWNQRSVDTFLGLPYNIASYALLLEILAKEVNMIPEELIGNLGDTHLYLNHIKQAEEQIARVPYKLPKLYINTEFWQTTSGECGVGDFDTNLQGFEIDDFILHDYQSHSTIKATLNN